MWVSRELVPPNRGFSANSLLLLLILLLHHISGGVLCQKTQCGLYGQPACNFVPVPKGATPPCAGIGRTYCEHVPNYPKTQIRNIIRKLQYDVQVHLVDEIPVEFTDMHVKPDTKYGVPPVISGNTPPSPTYGVPGFQPGSPSASFPNEFERTPPPKPPSPTYGVPNNLYIPPVATSNNKNFQQEDRNYLKNNNRGGTSREGGYVYEKPNAKLKSAKVLAQGKDSGDDSKSDENESGEKVKSIELTTTGPSAAPEFFFSEQFDRPLTTSPPAVVTPSQLELQQRQQQQPVFHPQEQPFLPNSPPAPFSTAVYQQDPRLRLQQQQQLEPPLPTLARDPQPPAVDAKDYFRYDSLAAQSNYNQADWFRRISRSLMNESITEETIKQQLPPAVNVTFIQELREKQETLRLLFPGGPEGNREELDEDLIIDFNAARALGGNRTHRIKRQQSLTRQVMCETTAQYIEPQAALTRDGEWKFIVNQVESARQLVKVEYCATESCSNLCILPNGYSSRCEQKYVQKRLVSLDASGSSIYTDTFWFPSCCVCTISNPN